MSVNEKMTAIADAIRGYGSITGKLNLDEMANKIGTVYLNGYDLGRVQGEEAGFNEGKFAEQKAFWDSYQQNGTRTDYSSCFSGAGWTIETFRPTHNINPTQATMMFKDSAMEIDLVEHLKALGIKLDFSNCTRLTNCFQNSNFTKIGIIDASNVAGSNANDIFTGSSKLVTIELLILSSNAATSGTFGGCTALQNLTVGGTIGINFSVKDCVNLSKDSIVSIIEHLSDTATSRTVTLSKTAVNNAFGIDIDNESTYTEEWNTLRSSKSKWTFNYV